MSVFLQIAKLWFSRFGYPTYVLDPSVGFLQLIQYACSIQSWETDVKPHQHQILVVDNSAE